MMPGNNVLPEILFMRKRNAFAEQWNGRMYAVAEASRISGIKEIWDASELGPFLQALKNKQPYQPKAENILMTGRRRPRTPGLRVLKHSLMPRPKTRRIFFCSLPGNPRDLNTGRSFARQPSGVPELVTGCAMHHRYSPTFVLESRRWKSR